MKSAVAALLMVHVGAVSPMEKVLTMLADVEHKLVEDGKAAEAAHEKYSKFCLHGLRDLEYDIKDGKNTVEQLTANIEKASSEIEVSVSKLEQLQGQVLKAEADLKAAQELRAKDQKAHLTAKSELSDASDMLGRALKTLSQKVTPSMLQKEVHSEGLLEALGAVVDAAAFPSQEKQSLLAFVEGATQDPAYSKSQNIVSILEDMKAKARDELNTLIMEDKKADHSFSMLKQSLEMQLSASEKEIQQSKLVQSEARQAKASSETDLDGSSKDLGNDQSSLRKLQASCAQADTDFEESNKHQQEEMEALDKAQKVLQETSGASARVYGMLQIKAHQPEDLTASFQVVRMVRTLAKKSRSETLEDLAANIESLVQTRQAPDVFAKVKDMIESMIASRKQEAASEQTKKAYCEEEKGKTKTKLDELSSKEESLGAKVDQKTSQAATLKTEAAELQKELAQLTQLQVEMDETRKAESAEFKKQKVDLQSGLEGVRSAISVLRDYYSSSSGSATGILSMLEVVESDFGRSLAEAETVEASKAQEHTSMTKQNDLTKVQKETDAKFKSKTSADLSKAVLDLAADSETMKEELAAVLSYQESLAKQCYDGGMSYEERAAKREEEIQGLKEALAALSDGSVLLQSKLRGAVKPHLG